MKSDFFASSLSRYSVMAHCWNHDPATRPSFKQLVSMLAGMVSDNADYLQVSTFEIPS